MKTIPLRTAVVALVLLLLPSTVRVAEPDRPEFVPGEILLQFRPEATEDQRKRVLVAHGLQLLRALRSDGILKLRIPQGVNPRTLAARLRQLVEVVAAEPNYYRYLHAVPNDPLFGQMWGLNNTGQTGGTVDADIDAPAAWDIAIGSSTVVVAVVDSGIDLSHPDLQANLYSNPGETANGIDDDGNGFVDDVQGWDFVDNDNDPTDPSAACASHGTHTAGTVGAVGNNGIGVTGVAQKVKIMPLRVFARVLVFCSARDSDILEALAYIKLMGVPISNNSWGGGPFSQIMRNAIAGTRGLFVASAGNAGTNNDASPSYPASYDLESIISVAATTRTDALASFSNFGALAVDIAAPGEQILSTTRFGNYGLLSGTSMSAPHVAGAAAVLLGRDPTLTAHEIRAKLLRGADFKGLPLATGGRLNLLNSLTLPPSAVTIDVAPLGPTVISRGTAVSYSVQLTNTSGSTRVVTASVRAWTPEGGEVPLQGPLSVTLAAGQAVSASFIASIPAAAPVGGYRLIGRVQNATDVFDEDPIVYTVN